MEPKDLDSTPPGDATPEGATHAEHSTAQPTAQPTARPRVHPYVRFGGVYVALDRNPAVMAQRLRRNARAWNPTAFGPLPGALGTHVPASMRAELRFWRFALSCWNARVRGGIPAELIELPATGDIMLPMKDGGYRVIDFEARTVHTLFPSTLRRERIQQLVERAERVARHDFAPVVFDHSDTERWMAEELIEGQPARRELGHERLVLGVLLPLAQRIALAEPPRYGCAAEYGTSLADSIRANLAFVTDDSERTRLETFVQHAAATVTAQGDLRLGLVMSHGDLWRGNVILSRGRSVAVDWDSLGRRSALYDAYYASFITLEEQPQYDPKALRGQLAHITSEMRDVLHEAGTDFRDVLPPNPTSSRFFRALFYLEFLQASLRDCRETTSIVVRRDRAARITRFRPIFERLEEDTKD